MAVSRRMDKNILIHSHKGMQYSKETKWTTTAQNPINLMKKMLTNIIQAQKSMYYMLYDFVNINSKAGQPNL